MQLATTLARAYRRWRIARISTAALTTMLATASAAHAHGGMAGPSEIGPPLLTSGALGFACYWLVMLWPSAKNRRTPDDPGKNRKATGNRARSNGNGQSNLRKSAH